MHHIMSGSLKIFHRDPALTIHQKFSHLHDLCFLCLVRILICHLHLAVLIKPRCILVCTQTSRLCAFVVVLPVDILADLG